jgi:hypothetical protein
MNLPVAIEIFIVQGYRIEQNDEYDILIICYCLWCIVFVLYIVLISLVIK